MRVYVCDKQTHQYLHMYLCSVPSSALYFLRSSISSLRMEFSTCFRGNMWWYLMETTFRLVCAPPSFITQGARIPHGCWWTVLTCSVTAAWKAFSSSFVVCRMLYFIMTKVTDCELQMEDGRIAHIQYEHDGTFLQEQQVEPRADYNFFFLCYRLYYAAFKFELVITAW